MPAGPERPIVYSCSGCSSAAQMANHIALELGRRGLAEMSCIAGIGGAVKAILNHARSGRDLIALDGCKLACVRKTLEREGLEPTVHHILADYGVHKVKYADFDGEQAQRIMARVVESLPEPTRKRARVR